LGVPRVETGSCLEQWRRLIGDYGEKIIRKPSPGAQTENYGGGDKKSDCDTSVS